MYFFLEKLFDLEKKQTTVRTEVMAGLATFSTMIYIIFVNPRILSQTGMDYSSILTATVLSSFFTSLCMGLFANFPFALAPGMGLNAFFTYGIVIGGGFTWQVALGACFWSGIIFLLLNVTDLRRKILNAIPIDIRYGTAAGIGLFLAFNAFKDIQIVVPDQKTLLSLGDMGNPSVLLTGLGVVLITTLMTYNVKGAIFLTTLTNWFLGLIFGLVQWRGIFGLPSKPTLTFMQLDILGALDVSLIPIISAFVFVSIFDTAGTTEKLCDEGGFSEKDGKIPRFRRMMTTDALGTIVGSCMGTAPFSTYVESLTGISAGGRTGLTAITVSFLFLIALFLEPFALSIPPFATAPALIVIGALMTKQAKNLDWNDLTEFVPGFITMITIPMTFNIASGIALGFVTYPLIKLLTGRIKDIHPIIWIIAVLFSLKFIAHLRSG